MLQLSSELNIVVPAEMFMMISADLVAVYGSGLSGYTRKQMGQSCQWK